MTPADKIRARVAELRGIRERYLAYQLDRVSERDHHGAWDVAVNLSETECEISGLEFALAALADSEAMASAPPLEGGKPRRWRVWVDGDEFCVSLGPDKVRYPLADIATMLARAADDPEEAQDTLRGKDCRCPFRAPVFFSGSRFADQQCVKPDGHDGGHMVGP